MSQHLPKRSLGDVLSLRHPNHFILAGANNRNVICVSDCRSHHASHEHFQVCFDLLCCSLNLECLYVLTIFNKCRDISLFRQLYSKNTALFNLTILGNDAFSAMCVCQTSLLECKYCEIEIFVLVLGVACTLLSEVE